MYSLKTLFELKHDKYNRHHQTDTKNKHTHHNILQPSGVYRYGQCEVLQ